MSGWAAWRRLDRRRPSRRRCGNGSRSSGTAGVGGEAGSRRPRSAPWRQGRGRMRGWSSAAGGGTGQQCTDSTARRRAPRVQPAMGPFGPRHPANGVGTREPRRRRGVLRPNTRPVLDEPADSWEDQTMRPSIGGSAPALGRRRCSLIVLVAAPTLACGGLIGPNGAVNLLRTTTFAGYHDGVEHYVTAFKFAEAAASSAGWSRSRACRRTSSEAATGLSSGSFGRPNLVSSLSMRSQGAARRRRRRVPHSKIDRRARHHRAGRRRVGGCVGHRTRLPPAA